MNSKSGVEQAHREMATAALMLGVSDNVLLFEATGETGGDEWLEAAARVAVAIGTAELRGEQRGLGRAGCFVDCNNGTSRCAGCGFTVRGAPSKLMGISLPGGGDDERA